MSWSPDGQSVVFSAVDPQDDNHFHLWLADTSEFKPERVTSRRGYFLDPSFGPDGSEISYVAFPEQYQGIDTERLEVFRMRLDGLVEERLTIDSLEDGKPSWSPDGRNIVFETITDKQYLFRGKWALRSVAIEGRAIDTLLADGTVNQSPRWTPDGSSVLFQQRVGSEINFGLRSIAVLSIELVDVIGIASSADQVDVDPVSAALD